MASFRILVSSMLMLISMSQANARRAFRFLIPIDSNVIYQINEGQNLPLLPKENFNVLVWNMYKGGKDTWARDFKKLIKGQDILMLQEILTTPEMMTVLREDQDRSYFLATSFFDKWSDLARSGVATASTYEAIEVDWQRSKHREPLVRTPKMSSVAAFQFEDSDKSLLTINIHAVNFVSKRKLFHMVNQGLKKAKAHYGPVIFAGDFNTWSKKKLRGVDKMMRKAGFKAVTFEEDTRMLTFKKPLDHIYVRDLAVNSSRVYGEVEGSDHKAMQVNLSYLGN